MTFLYQIFGSIIYFLYSFLQNYGVAIIVFTILIKLALLPLNIKSTQSMQEIQKLSLVTQHFQKKYKSNPEKLNQVTSQLYKIYHVNPLGGCWPLLIQLPIIYALFGALRNPTEYVFTNGNIDAISQGFLWIPNLSNPDPRYILPILCVIFTFLTQWYTNKVANPTGDETAQTSNKMMQYFMPLFIGWLALSVPAGVALYWVTQNIFTFVQQFFMLRKKEEPIPIAEAEAKLAEYNKQQKDKIRVARQMGTDRRNEMMGIEEPKKKKKKTSSVKMKPASGKTVKRKTITKIPERKPED